MRQASVLFALSLFVGCNGNNGSDAIDLNWEAGEEFHVATSYRIGSPRTEEGTVSLEGTEERALGELWTNEVVWTYQVVETGLTPEPSDELYPYAETRDGVAPLAVIRAYVDASLNEESDVQQADPVIYLVFREDRDRLAAVISYAFIDGDRIERAYSSQELGKSWSTLSQSQLVDAPTYLAPFGIRHTEEERILENGSTVETVAVDNGVTDAFFDDELGGGLVATRYEEGQPWPTWTVSDNMESHLLSGSDVDARRADRPWVASDAPELLDYRQALAAAIDIDSALVLDIEQAQSGSMSGQTREGYEPWAGSWWPQSKGELIFGYRGYGNNTDTLSDLLREDIDPIKKEMDELSEELREMEDGDEKTEKRERYKELQSDLVDKLRTFYDGILQGLDGGTIVVADGHIKREGDDAFDFELNELSPFDKFALQMYTRGETYPNPFYLPAWEVLNHYSPKGGSWWGHCNGWSAAAILTHEPRESITVPMGDEEVEYTSADLKGLLSESHYSTRSQFYGARYYKEGDDKGDLTPKAFHKLVTFFIGSQEVPMVFDTTATEQVWNYPAYAYEMDLDETTPEGAEALINLNDASFDELEGLPGIGDVIAQRILEHRQKNGAFQSVEELLEIEGIGDGRYGDVKDLVTVSPFERTFSVTARVKFTTDGVDEEHVDTEGQDPNGFTKTYRYTLTTNANGVVMSGEWADIEEHPDFAWIPYNNPTWRSQNGSENGYLPYGDLVDVIGDSFERH